MNKNPNSIPSYNFLICHICIKYIFKIYIYFWSLSKVTWGEASYLLVFIYSQRIGSHFIFKYGQCEKGKFDKNWPAIATDNDTVLGYSLALRLKFLCRCQNPIWILLFGAILFSPIYYWFYFSFLFSFIYFIFIRRWTMYYCLNVTYTFR